jgi:hypothetical protein
VLRNGVVLLQGRVVFDERSCEERSQHDQFIKGWLLLQWRFLQHEDEGHERQAVG